MPGADADPTEVTSAIAAMPVRMMPLMPQLKAVGRRINKAESSPQNARQQLPQARVPSNRGTCAAGRKCDVTAPGLRRIRAIDGKACRGGFQTRPRATNTDRRE